MTIDASHSLPTTSPHLTPGEYQGLAARISGAIRDMLPSTATVLVVSRGDEDLLRLDGWLGWHFPQADDGKYAGYHPPSSEEAIAHLEDLKGKGAEYLLFPSTAFWWLGHYEDFARHLIEDYQLVYADQTTCVVFALNGHEAPGGAIDMDFGEGPSRSIEQLREVALGVLPEGASALVITGDDDDLDLHPVWTRRFSLNQAGDHGSRPGEGREPILRLKQLRREGADFLIVPEHEFWRLDQCTDFRRYLETRYRLVLHQEHVCMIYDLSDEPGGPEAEDSLSQTTRQRLTQVWRRS
jgi:hypothetical protein